MTKQKSITVLGSTGSIGNSTLALVRAHPEQFKVYALVAGRNLDLLIQQALEFQPEVVGISDESEFASLRDALCQTRTRVVAGQDACDALAGDKVDLVVAGIVGLAGLASVHAAVTAGNVIALANKESLVSAGSIICDMAARKGARLLPLDSEHSAIFQCWSGWSGHQTEVGTPQDLTGVSHICLTASGGPFRERPLNSFESITRGEAVAHPNWKMGQKISVDSATMMNKGLEVIEAAWLFDMQPDQIEVVIHPQVVIHGLVYFRDGSVIGQLGSADMRTPISYAMAWPDRLNWNPEPLNLLKIGRFDFIDVDPQRYPCYTLARQALSDGGAMPAVLNAANEVAVGAFLEDRLSFSRIADIVKATLEQQFDGDVSSIAAVLDLDGRARQIANDLIEG